MNEHFGPAPDAPPPPPPPDGLVRAFRTADRRRFRTAALTSALPGLLAVALAVAPGANTTASIEPTAPIPSESTSPTATASPGEEDPAGGGPESSPAPGETPAPTGEPSASPAPASPTASPESRYAVAVAPDTVADNGKLVVSGSGTSSGEFVLTEDVEIGILATHYDGNVPETYGVYIEAVDASVGVGVVHLPNAPAGHQWDLIDYAEELPAGRYRAWLIGTGPASATIALGAGDPVVAVSTTTMTTTTFVSESAAGAAGTMAEKRLSFTPPGRAVGVLGGSTTGTSSDDFVVCLTEHNGSCDGGGAGGGTSGGSGTGWVRSAIRHDELRPGETRDVLAQQPSGVATTVTAWYFLLHL